MQRLNKLIKADSLVGLSHDSVEEEIKKRTLATLRAIMSNADHPLFHIGSTAVTELKYN